MVLLRSAGRMQVTLLASIALAWQLSVVTGAVLGPLVENLQVKAYDLNTEPNGVVPGSCGYGAINETSWPYGAIASVQSNSTLVKSIPMESCGTCFMLSCAETSKCRENSLPVTALIVDSCPTCTAEVNLINIPIQRFASLSSITGATVVVNAQQVDCAPPGNIIVRVLNNPTLNLMLEIALLDVAGSGIIRAVDLKNSQQDDSAWVPMSVYDGAIWQAGNLPPTPIDVRITNQAGQQVVAKQIYSGGAGGDTMTGVQFPSTAVTTPSPMPAISASAPAIAPAPSTTTVATAGSPPPPTPDAAQQPPPVSPPPALAPQPPPANGLAPTPLASPPAAGLPNCPANTSNLQVAPKNVSEGQQCRTLLSILQSSPSLSEWLNTLQERGLSSSLDNVNQQLTMFAPINSAFNCNVFAGSSSYAATIGQIMNATQNSAAALVGGQVVAGDYTSDKLQPGTQLNTTDIIKNIGQSTAISVTVAPASVSGPIKIQGVGSVASILEADITACGPSVLHVTDSFILPFAPTAAAAGLGADAPLAKATEGPAVKTIDVTFAG